MSLNKLELELCERLNWRLLPSANDLRELLDALGNPQAPFLGRLLQPARRAFANR